MAKTVILGRLKDFNKALKEAINEMASTQEKIVSVSKHIGKIKLADGRFAKITLTVDADHP